MEHDIEDSQALWEPAIFGRQVEDFLAGDIGRYLVKRAEAEVDLAVDKLKKVDPTDVQTITSLQNTILVAESIQQWLGDAIRLGLQAKEILEDQG